MRYIKTYEYVNGPQIGEYVICEEPSNAPLIKDFLENNIGKIVDYDGGKYEVFYENVPKNLMDSFYRGKRLMTRDEIKHHAKNIDDLDSIITGNKYNL